MKKFEQVFGSNCQYSSTETEEEINMEKNYIFDVEAEAANGIPHTTNIAGTVVKQSHH